MQKKKKTRVTKKSHLKSIVFTQSRQSFFKTIRKNKKQERRILKKKRVSAYTHTKGFFFQFKSSTDPTEGRLAIRSRKIIQTSIIKVENTRIRKEKFTSDIFFIIVCYEIRFGRRK